MKQVTFEITPASLLHAAHNTSQSTEEYCDYYYVTSCDVSADTVYWLFSVMLYIIQSLGNCSTIRQKATTIFSFKAVIYILCSFSNSVLSWPTSGIQSDWCTAWIRLCFKTSAKWIKEYLVTHLSINSQSNLFRHLWETHWLSSSLWRHCCVEKDKMFHFSQLSVDVFNI